MDRIVHESGRNNYITCDPDCKDGRCKKKERKLIKTSKQDFYFPVLNQ